MKRMLRFFFYVVMPGLAVSSLISSKAFGHHTLSKIFLAVCASICFIAIIRAISTGKLDLGNEAMSPVREKEPVGFAFLVVLYLLLTAWLFYISATL